MEGTRRSLWISAAVLLLICTLASRVDAQQFVCWPIADGDTASSLARRLTGHASAAYGLSFQIRDPARRMFVPKSHYQRLQSDWQACVAPGPVPNVPAAYSPDVELAPTPSMTADAPASTPAPVVAAAAPLALVHVDRAPFDLPYASTIGAALVLLMVLAAVAGSFTSRPMPPAVRRAGENFIAVFARPLVDESTSAPPIQTRLRFRRRKQQLEIRIAPGPGHRYPNLADHKKNVEYDVDRVMRILGNFALDKPPQTAGKWVVVTIGLRERNAPRGHFRTEEGAR